MATRAIIARGIMNGYFTSWCWVDGEPGNIGGILQDNFTSDEDVDELISYKSILGIYYDPSDDPHKNIPGSYTKLHNGLYVKHDDGKKTVVSGGYDGFFPSLSIMLQEFVHYIYIYNNGSWIIYHRESNANEQNEQSSNDSDNANERSLHRLRSISSNIRNRINERINQNQNLNHTDDYPN